jgi:predicted nucleic acid-binding protein
MKVVADTDILSIFAKIRRLDILKKLFDEVIVPPSVNSELRKGKLDISPLMPPPLMLTRAELKELRSAERGLGKGEKECVVVARTRGIPLATNDKIVHKLCRAYNIGYFSLPRLLRFAISEGVITRAEAKQLVTLIEERERTTIRNKKEIFK